MIDNGSRDLFLFMLFFERAEFKDAMGTLENFFPEVPGRFFTKMCDLHNFMSFFKHYSFVNSPLLYFS